MTTQRVALLCAMFVIVIPAAAVTAIVLWSRHCSTGETVDSPYRQFTEWIAAGRNTEAMELGGSLFHALLQEKPNDAALALLARELDIAGQIRTAVADRAQPAPTVLLDEIAGMENLGPPAPTIRNKAGEKGLLPPARDLYWTHLGTFAAERASGRPRTPQTKFCERYYELSMQNHILEIGRHVLVTDPNSSESLCDAVVLPLLSLHGRDGDWDQMESFLSLFRPEMLDLLSTFALLQADRPQAAMAIARYRARVAGEAFSPTAWAFGAADACVVDHRPDLADNAALLGRCTRGRLR